MQRRLFLFALVFASMLPTFDARAAATSTPRAAIDHLETGLIAIMKDAKKLGYEGRLKRIKPVVEETHDLAGIAQITAGRYWSDFTAEQRKRFVDAFSDLSIATYAARFDGYSGEAFKFQGERKLENGDVVVQSVLSAPGSETTRFDYVLRQKDGRWAIVNIIADGVSDLAIKRSEYGSVIRAEGIDALIAKIRGKVNDAAKTNK